MGTRHLRLATALPAPSPQRASGDAALAAYQREVAYVFRTLQWLGARPSEIEDLAQEVFLGLRHSWPQYDPTRPLRPYLFGLAFRIVSADRRKRRREVVLGTVEIRDLSPGPEQVLQAKETRAVVLRALERIPLRRRAVFVMHYLDDVPMDQVAAALSIPLFTAYSRLRSARKEFEAAVRRLIKESTEL